MQPTDSGNKSALSRRAFVGKLAAGAAVATAASAIAAGGAAALATPEHYGPAEAPAADDAARAAAEKHAAAAAVAPPPWELLRPLALGAVVARGWQVAALSGASDGSCIVTLRNACGRTQRVHICRNDGRPQGLVYTDRFDLVVMNGGQGDLPTEEGMAQAVAEVAHVLATNERTAGAPVLAALLPHAERVDRFANAGKLR